MTTPLPDWSFTTTFRAPPRVKSNWSPIAPFAEAACALFAREADLLPGLLERWPAHDLGPDPITVNWDNFRPLRPSREEDWSDWLAWLLSTSTTGGLATRLFREGGPRPQVSREETVTDGYRLDLLIWWTKIAATHVEVKVGDQDFLKTFRTARAIEQWYRGASIEHLILLPEADTDTWKDTARPSGTPAVDHLTWRQVVVALRRSILDAKKIESVTWRAFAYAFSGAAAQRLLFIGNVQAEHAKGTFDLQARAADAVRLLKEDVNER